MERFTFYAYAHVEGHTLTGRAHTFGQRAMAHGRCIEFAVGAFDKALEGSDVRAFWNHDSTLLLGRQSNGTVRLNADSEGLDYAIDVPETSYGNDLLALVDRGDLTEMSFGINPGKSTTRRASDGTTVTTYSDVSALLDISPVSLPAFEGTAIELHSLSDDESVRSQLARARQRARETN